MKRIEPSELLEEDADTLYNFHEIDEGEIEELIDLMNQKGKKDIKKKPLKMRKNQNWN